jgi:hypothetical protein
MTNFPQNMRIWNSGVWILHAIAILSAIDAIPLGTRKSTISKRDVSKYFTKYEAFSVDVPELVKRASDDGVMSFLIPYDGK